MKPSKFNNIKFYVLDWDENRGMPYAANIIHYIDSKSMFKKIKYKGKLFGESYEKRKYYSIQNYYELRDYLIREFMYHCWSKCEMEMFVHGHFDADREKEIDVWSMIGPNIDLITKLIIQECEIPFKIPDKPLDEYNEDKIDFILPKY